MAAEGDVIKSGTIFIEDNRIAAIVPKGQPAPAGFDAVEPVATGGTIYPGLIELHNHLSYNILPLCACRSTSTIATNGRTPKRTRRR